MGNNQLVLIDDSVFQKLQQEMLIVMSLNGDIIQKDSSAEILFPLDNFFEHFEEEVRKEVFIFFQKLINSGVVCHDKLLYKKNQLILKGLMQDELLYLSVVYHETPSLNEKKINMISKWSWDFLRIGVIGLDNNDKIMECNQACIDYLHLEENGCYIGEYFKDLIKEENILKLLESLNEEIRSKHVPIQRYYYDDEGFYLIQAFYYKEDMSVYFFISDHTYLQKFENLLLYKEQMEQVSHLAAGVAHEIRNPLSVIKGFIQLANYTQKFDQFYGTVMSEIDRMNEIIEDFLAISKKRSFKRDKYKPHDIIKSNISIMQSECLLHGINLQHYFDAEQDFLVEVNEGMIKQVILNLLRNAIEAFKDSSGIEYKQISIRAIHKDDNYIIEFIDNGPGMDANILKQLGKPFYTTKEKGTGIGIPLCKKLIQDHGGTFTINSTVGEGTTIRLTLPLIANKMK